MRTALLVGFVTSILVPACAESEPGDELAAETSADDVAGKGDAAGAGAFTYLNLVPDNRACSLDAGADCGTGFFVSRANRSTTQCGRGVPQAQCKVLSIDWSGTGMPASVAKGYEDDLRAGTPLLVRGEIVPAPDDRGISVAVTEIWVASQPEWVDGVFALVKDNGIRCITAPCPSLTEQKLNSTLSANITGLDFDGVDKAAAAQAHGALYSDGLIVVGDRDYDARGGKVRTVNKFFTKAPVPQY